MNSNTPMLPPGQQLAAPGKWPLVGESEPWEPDRPWVLRLEGLVERPQQWSLEQLRSMVPVDRRIDIHCVTRWSRLQQSFRGILLSSLLAECKPQSAARFISFIARSPRQHSTSLPLSVALELDTLLALEADNQPLDPLHGGPLRVVVPKRYFYKSLKWVERVEILAEDRLGYWEAEAGYHNEADPWKEQRYVASSISKQKLRELLTTRDFSNQELLSLELAGHSLPNLVAQDAKLRNADFSRADLRGARFDGTNLTNARFCSADLRNAQLRDADLEGCDFSGADLRHADLRESSMFGATFATSPSTAGSSVADDSGQNSQRLEAIVDATTRIDPASIAQLVPEQAEFLKVRLGLN